MDSVVNGYVARRVEHWFRTIKERTKRFYNSFPSRKGIT